MPPRLGCQSDVQPLQIVFYHAESCWRVCTSLFVDAMGKSPEPADGALVLS